MTEPDSNLLEHYRKQPRVDMRSRQGLTGRIQNYSAERCCSREDKRVETWGMCKESYSERSRTKILTVSKAEADE